LKKIKIFIIIYLES